jgi:hypothetical protein
MSIDVALLLLSWDQISLGSIVDINDQVLEIVVYFGDVLV